jgi:hypothetical protein
MPNTTKLCWPQDLELWLCLVTTSEGEQWSLMYILGSVNMSTSPPAMMASNASMKRQGTWINQYAFQKHELTLLFASDCFTSLNRDPDDTNLLAESAVSPVE